MINYCVIVFDPHIIVRHYSIGILREMLTLLTEFLADSSIHGLANIERAGNIATKVRKGHFR